MRKITDHIVEGDSAPQLDIEVTDEPGHGGANHNYLIAPGLSAQPLCRPSAVGRLKSMAHPDKPSQTRLPSICHDRLSRKFRSLS